MTSCKTQALAWVHRYAVGGAAFAAIPIPTTSATLVALETHMMALIGAIYGAPPAPVAAAAAAGGLAAGGQALKWLAMQGACFIPGFGVPIRMGIAGAAIEALGQGIINHYESQFPGKVYTGSQHRSVG
ncbi:MAG TPA: hypothetical protein ENK23_04375 [Sorangium sp.]|nr:hypothetical protein [Sorangium sp.]